jgi:hypothetical protein
MIIDSFAAQKFEVRDFKYFTFHLRIQIGIESGTPMVQLVIFHRTEFRYYFGTTIIIGNLMFFFKFTFPPQFKMTREFFFFKKDFIFSKKIIVQRKEKKFSLLSYVFFSS